MGRVDIHEMNYDFALEVWTSIQNTIGFYNTQLVLFSHIFTPTADQPVPTMHQRPVVLAADDLQLQRFL